MVRVKQVVKYAKRPEKLIRGLILDELRRDGWYCWYPPRARFNPTDADIFGMYDVGAWKGNQIRFIQLTTAENFSAREAKVRGILRKENITVPLHVSSEIWGLMKDGGWKVGVVR